MVQSVDAFWHQKYAEEEGGKLVPVVAGGSNGDHSEGTDGSVQGGMERSAAADHHEIEHEPGEGHGHGSGIHMPSPSYFPVVAALGLPILAYGLLYSTVLVIDGAITLLVGLYGWAMEPSAE